MKQNFENFDNNDNNTIKRVDTIDEMVDTLPMMQALTTTMTMIAQKQRSITQH